MHAIEGNLRGEYNDAPHLFPNLRTFGAARTKYFALELTKNSPLTPLFKMAALQTFENAVYHRLLILWIGAPITYKREDELTVLSAGQVFMIFSLLILLLGIAFIILIMEMIASKLWMQYIKNKKALHWKITNVAARRF